MKQCTLRKEGALFICLICILPGACGIPFRDPIVLRVLPAGGLNDIIQIHVRKPGDVRIAAGKIKHELPAFRSGRHLGKACPDSDPVQEDDDRPVPESFLPGK